MTDNEVWKAVSGYEGRYEVSSHGSVRRAETHRAVTQWPNTNGYLYVFLSRDGVQKRQHVPSLMLAAFVGPRPDGHVTCHLDGNRQHNRLPNLKWGTRKENISHQKIHGTVAWGSRNGKSKQTEAGVLEIRKASANGESYASIARRTGYSDVNIRYICTGATWKHLPIHPASETNDDQI